MFESAGRTVHRSMVGSQAEFVNCSPYHDKNTPTTDLFAPASLISAGAACAFVSSGFQKLEGALASVVRLSDDVAVQPVASGDEVTAWGERRRDALGSGRGTTNGRCGGAQGYSQE
jgi:hypothetical protein